MNEREIADLLERTARAVDAPPAPVDLAFRGRSAGRRRRRGVVAVAAAVAVMAGVGVALPSLLGGEGSGRATSQPIDLLPVEGNAVGLADVQVNLPDTFERGRFTCGSASDHREVWDLSGGVVPACLGVFPLDSVSVELEFADPGSAQPEDAEQVDLPGGGTALRTPVRCGADAVDATRETCSAQLRVSSIAGRDVSVRVVSSRGAASVDEVLDTVRRSDRVGVPDHGQTDVEIGSDPSFQDEAPDGQTDRYLALLSDLGLRYVFAQASDMPEGVDPGTPTWILEIEPTPGTLVEPGSEVLVTVGR